ncbi:38ac8818-b859-41ef-8be3-4c88351f2fb2 [Thermothielavioides terrestris]|uniref:38ac8818-b859-41ef-8be3-4c88351f2fb2 n=1 Tax=Thermothielavioides terrestris TaxID=2587410 RepID=A0A3S4C1H5_9PEZI|nr:38ac8818-b859-41ef-8be3-4c88351f2fb2 [Thermothielavioides terrestris]
MPTARKRPLQNADLNDKAQEAKQPSMLHRIRNMWQFANLFQFILLFGQALKINDNMDIEDLEAECLKPGSMALQDIGLSLLKFLSSHRGLTHELFDEYARRQFLAKAPDKNPFGTAEVPARFADFDVFTKIRVLQLMTQLIMINPERLREKTEEQRDTDQTNWRIEPYGWDRHDRTYFVLDDNRLYRLTDAPPPPPKPKKNTKKAKAAQRARKRRRVASGEASDVDDAGDEASEAEAAAEPQDDGLGGMKWECLAVSLEEVRGFLSTLQKTKDPNEKTLRDQIQDHLLPILEKQEASRKRKQLQREKELLSLEKMAHAKRSSRIASKMEQRRREEQAREEEQRRREAEAASRKALQQRLKMERERDNRLMSREQRLKERETRRRLHEEELAQLSENSRGERSASARMSERRRLAEIERNKKALQELEEEEDDWIFDCVCGVHGQVDDGTHSVACERCNVWQHSKCLGINEQEADKDDFHFVCS